jgi:hypothetical protein
MRNIRALRQSEMVKRNFVANIPVCSYFPAKLPYVFADRFDTHQTA